MRNGSIDYVVVSLIAVGILALAGAGVFSAGWRAGVFAIALSLAAVVGAARHDWPLLAGPAFARHLSVALAVFWTATAALLQWARYDRPGTLGAQMVRASERTALGFGVIAGVVVLFEMAVAALLRTGLTEPAGWTFETTADGLVDLAGLMAAVCLSPAARRRVTPLFWLMVATVGWSALMIPAGLESRYVVTSWPRWMPWTLWAYVGMSLVLFGIVLAQGLWRQRRRKRAWPDHLEWLCDPHDPWPGFRPSAAAVAMALLPLGAYHASSFLVMPCAILAAGATLRLAHRQWNPNFADVGMAFVTLAVVSFTVACVPDAVGGTDLTTRMPILLAASMIGLAVMVFMWQWLPNVWDQQLQDGRPWTTTGRMLPLARRIGLITAVFGVLAAMQLALWPEIASVRDDSVGRWVLGLSANAILLTAMVLATRLSQWRRLGGLALLTLALAGVFVAVRFPDNRIKFWLLEHWPTALALFAPIPLGLSKLADRGRWRPFVGWLEASAVLLIPALAVLGTITTSWHPTVMAKGKVISYDAASLRTWTWAVLAVHYGLCAYSLKRRFFGLVAAVFLAAALGNLALARG